VLYLTSSLIHPNVDPSYRGIGTKLAVYAIGMAGKINFVIVGLLAVLSLETTATAATKSAPFGITNRFEGPAGQFTIDLPVDWKPIKPNVLLALVDPYARDLGAESGRVLQYGFGPVMSDIIPNPPYLMIEVNRVRRMPERMMALHSDKDWFERTIAANIKHAGVEEFRILETSFDKERHVVRFSYTQIEPFAQSELHIIQSVFYTESGAVRVMAVCPSAGWNTWSNTIETTLASVQIPARLHYKARPALTVVSRQAMSLQMLLVCFVVPLVSIVGWLILHRNCGEIMSDEI